MALHSQATVFAGSSMRTVERFLIRRNLESLYAKLRIAETEGAIWVFVSHYQSKFKGKRNF